MTEYEIMKRCPKCGSEPMGLVYTSNPPQYGYSHCGIDSGRCKSMSEAVAKWNEQVYLHTHQEKASKHTQKEVIKALELCTNKEIFVCDQCVFQKYKMGHNGCLAEMLPSTLDLINRLKTRIVRYQLKNTNQRNALASLNEKVAEQKARIEELQHKITSCNSENAELKAEIDILIRKKESLRDEIAEQQAEIERLKGLLESNAKYINRFEKVMFEMEDEE